MRSLSRTPSADPVYAIENRSRQVCLSSCISSQVEIGNEAALDTLAEIARNHFVVRRAMLLRMAERAVRNGGVYSAMLTEPSLQRLTETGLDFLAITAAKFQFRAVVKHNQKVSV
jgi:hypothetical protein